MQTTRHPLPSNNKRSYSQPGGEHNTSHSVDNKKKQKTSKYNVDSNTIWFKSNKGNGYAFLSNFWPTVEMHIQTTVNNKIERKCDFVVDGKSYKTVEHYYQAAKYEKQYPHIAEKIRASESALDAKKSNTRFKKRYPVDMSKFDDEQVMKKALFAKFSQHKGLEQALIDTRSTILSEIPGRGASKWCGGDKGDNLLGKLLMDVRDDIPKLREETNQKEKENKLLQDSQDQVWKWRGMLGGSKTIDGAYENWQKALMNHYKLVKQYGRWTSSVYLGDLDAESRKKLNI